MTATYALYANGDSAQRAVNRLRAVGVPDTQIVVISSQPMEDYEFAHAERRTWIWWIAGAGGVLGFAAARWLTAMTQTAWPIVTGNMPLIPWWTNLVIMFEMTMLGAIVATAIAFVFSARLPGRGGRLYDPAVSDGRILVGVENPTPDAQPRVERALAFDPTVQVKTV